MTSTIYRANQVDITKFSFGDQQTNKYGGKSSRCRYDGSDFFLQVPRMRLPFGLGTYEDKDPNTGEIKNTKYSINMSFSGYELDEDGNPGNKKVRDLFELMNKMKQLLVETAVDNSQAWLGVDEANEGVANALTRDILYWSKDKVTKKVNKKYAPTMKAKIGFWDGRFTVNAFDEKKQPVTELTTNLPKGSEVVCILKLQPVNFAGGKAGYSWQVYQMKIYKPAGMPSYAFVDDPDDDEPVRRVNVEESDEESTNNASKKEETLVEDSDDSEDAESEDELDVEDAESEDDSETVPPPVKKKKVVRRRKKKNDDE